MNILLGIVSLLLTFSLLIIVEKIFKKEGLFVWVSIATIIANILVCKSIELFSFTTNLGNILFASSFLATDIMSEKYGAKESRKAIILGVVSQVIFVIMTQIGLLYIPAPEDLAQESMKGLFSINIRVSIASIVMYFVSNMADIYIFEKIKEKVPGKLWLRNNVATIISNCSENFFFAFLAFAGIMSIPTIISIAITGSIIEILIAFCDTPFLYIAKFWKKKDEVVTT
jgi:uncharacterized integral membrane protein (TIGR00697 family)